MPEKPMKETEVSDAAISVIGRPSKNLGISLRSMRARTPVGTETFPLSLDKGSSFPVAVEWHYNGSYSGVALSDIRASGTAVV